MSESRTPTGLMPNRGLVADPATYANEAGAAAWLISAATGAPMREGFSAARRSRTSIGWGYDWAGSPGMVNSGVRIIPEVIADVLDPQRKLDGERRMVRVL